jgi:type II secretory pathway pseudopilin PulG
MAGRPMMTTGGSQRGMSLVEATIVLMTLMLLTSVLAPSLYDFIADARLVKVKEDCEAIGVSVVRLVGDVGPCLKLDAARDCTGENRVHVLFGRGDNAGWPVVNADDLEHQLTTNDPHYRASAWRGAYLSGPIGPDPWGSAYAVNARYLAPQSREECFTDVFCISAGPNRRFDTPFDGGGVPGTSRGGDDVVFTIGRGPCASE